MFTVDQAINDRVIRDKDLFKVLFSMNQHQVATPDLSVEDARSYVFFFREAGRISVYVGLYFIRTGARQYYKHSSNPFPESELSAIEGEARSFTEDLGAMLDELEFGTLSRDEKTRWFDEQDLITGGKKETPSQDAAVSAEHHQATARESVPDEPSPVLQQPAAERESDPGSEQHSLPPVQPAPPVEATTSVEVTPLVEVVPSVHASPPPPDQLFASAPDENAVVNPVSSRVVPPAPASMPLRTPDALDAEASPAPVPHQRQPVVPQKTVPAAGMSVSAPAAPADQQTSAPGQMLPNDVLGEAVRAGVVKAPKAKLKKAIRTATGAISRDKEALARLLASF